MQKRKISHLVILVELFVLSFLDTISHFLIRKANTIIEVTKPYNAIMILDRAIFLESEPLTDCCVIFISFIIIAKSGS